MLFNKAGRSGHITDHRLLDVATAAAAATSFWICGLVAVAGGGIVEFIFLDILFILPLPMQRENS